MSSGDLTLVRAGLWRWVQGTGLERFELRRGEDLWLLRGAILAQAGGEPIEARYQVACDGGWHTRRVEVALRDGRGERSLRLEAGGGGWTANGREAPALQGCLDVDLEWSPATNTLPVRRLGLAVGASAPLTAAWVRFPALAVEPLRQEYARLAGDRYRYASNGGAFVRELALDEHGLVLEYPGIWRRVAGE